MTDEIKADQLVEELTKAHLIILAMLYSMTPEQKTLFVQELGLSGISAFVATRYYERSQILQAFKAKNV